MSTINPYQPPTAGITPPERSPQQKKISLNINAICVLYLVLGSFAALIGFGTLFGPSDEIPRYVAGLIIALGLGGAVSAVGVLWRKKWGIPCCQLISALYLLSFPIGTILGGYFLLNINKVREDFS